MKILDASHFIFKDTGLTYYLGLESELVYYEIDDSLIQSHINKL